MTEPEIPVVLDLTDDGSLVMTLEVEAGVLWNGHGMAQDGQTYPSRNLDHQSMRLLTQLMALNIGMANIAVAKAKPGRRSEDRQVPHSLITKPNLNADLSKISVTMRRLVHSAYEERLGGRSFKVVFTPSLVAAIEEQARRAANRTIVLEAMAVSSEARDDTVDRGSLVLSYA